MNNEYRNAVWKYRLFQTLCCIGGLGLTVTTVLATSDLGYRKYIPRAIAGFAGFGLCLLGTVNQRQYQILDAAADRLDSVIATNGVAFTHLLTQPSRSTLKQANYSQTSIQGRELFDWAELVDGDRFPVLAVIAPMGGGKSRLVKYLGRHILEIPHITAVDSAARYEGDWDGCEIVRETDSLIAWMQDDLAKVEEEMERYRRNEPLRDSRFVVMEEAVDTLLSAKQKDNELTARWVEKYTTYTRKLRRRLCAVSVKMNGALMGLGAESRDQSVAIFPGQAGVKMAMADARYFKLGCKGNEDLRASLNKAIASIKHPALVYHLGEWHPASIPPLDAEGNPVGGTKTVSLVSIEPETELAKKTALDDLVNDAMDRFFEKGMYEEFQKMRQALATNNPELIKKVLSECLGGKLESSPHKDGQSVEGIPKEAIAILEFAKGKDWVSARDCKSGVWSLRGKTPDEIRGYFLLLIQAKRVASTGEGDRLKIRVF
jgi:hypothetical protein